MEETYSQPPSPSTFGVQHAYRRHSHTLEPNGWIIKDFECDAKCDEAVTLEVCAGEFGGRLQHALVS